MSENEPIDPDELSARDRRVMAPWPALLLIAVIAGAPLVWFAYKGVEMPGLLQAALVLVMVLPTVVAAGGDPKDVSAWVKEKIGR